jgi:hypothetical protein
MQPLNQPVELVNRELELNKKSPAAKVLAVPSSDPVWKPIFGFRAGNSEREAMASPRRAVEQIIVSGRKKETEFTG